MSKILSKDSICGWNSILMAKTKTTGKLGEVWEGLKLKSSMIIQVAAALRTREAASSMRHPSRNWMRVYWGCKSTGSEQGSSRWVHWKVTGEWKSHFPRLLISVSQTTLGLNFVVQGALWGCLWKEEACSRHLPSSQQEGHYYMTRREYACMNAWNKHY